MQNETKWILNKALSSHQGLLTAIRSLPRKKLAQELPKQFPNLHGKFEQKEESFEWFERWELKAKYINMDVYNLCKNDSYTRNWIYKRNLFKRLLSLLKCEFVYMARASILLLFLVLGWKHWICHAKYHIIWWYFLFKLPFI